MKVIVVAHGHPSIQKGGGEIAAYALFELLQQQGHDAVFVGWAPPSEINYNGVLRKVGKNDYLLYTTTDYFNFSAQSINLRKALETLLDAERPDVVHLHHYVHVGIEAAALIKKMSPNTRVILTLHEYLAICNNNGQLFTTENKVCKGYAPENCQLCFPAISANAFFMRELGIKAAFSFVDHFLSPSRFLRNQYVSWGISADKISVIENPFPITTKEVTPSLSPPAAGECWKIGFFGQINLYKGLDIVVEAVRLAIKQGALVQLGIHGKMSAVTGQEYIDELLSSIDVLGSYAKFYGPFQRGETRELMSKYHFIVMGSKWYENSPVVIQEAIEANRPLIVPSHGGMAEKVAGTGLLYQPGEAASLKQVFMDATASQYRLLCIQTQEASHSLNRCRMTHLQETLKVYLVGME